MSKPLRPYQREAVSSVLSAWEGGARATLLVLATGCGKTRTASEIVLQRRPTGRTLWLAHREELLSQASDAMQADAGLSVELERAEDKATVHGLFNTDVVVASVATLHHRRLQRWPQDAFSTIVVDEAHHATARGYQGILARFPAAKVLGLTATPDRTDGVGLGNVFESCAYRYGIMEGIRDGFLAPIRARKIVVGNLDLSTVRTTAGDLAAGDLERVMRVEGVIHQIASPLFQEAGSRQTIAFCPSVAVAEELARVLAGYAGPERVACISAQTGRAQRADILERYRAGEIQFITNCAVLTEGFDAPQTACIAMCRPTKSRALYTQCVGRGTRIAPGKDHCLLLDFCARNRNPDLVGPADVLAGKDLPDDVREAADRALTVGGDAEELDDVIKQAEEAAAEAQRKVEGERRKARLSFIVPYARDEMELFPALRDLADTATKTLKGGGEGATEKQRRFLESYGVAAPPATSKKSAGDLITYISKRNMPTFKQARLLAKKGLRIDISRPEAENIITALAANGWSVPADIAQQYRVA